MITPVPLLILLFCSFMVGCLVGADYMTRQLHKELDQHEGNGYQPKRPDILPEKLSPPSGPAGESYIIKPEAPSNRETREGSLPAKE